MNDTPLIDAVKNANISLVRDRLDSGDDVNQKNSAGDTALVSAAWRGHTDIARLLLERGANPTLVGGAQQTPLEMALAANRTETVALLRDPPQRQTTETWKKMGAATVAQVGIYPEIDKKLTHIFNFETRDCQIIVDDLKTRAQSVGPRASFDELPQTALETALAEFKRLGGATDVDFALRGSAALDKTRKDLLPKPGG